LLLLTLSQLALGLKVALRAQVFDLEQIQDDRLTVIIRRLERIAVVTREAGTLERRERVARFIRHGEVAVLGRGQFALDLAESEGIGDAQQTESQRGAGTLPQKVAARPAGGCGGRLRGQELGHRRILLGKGPTKRVSLPVSLVRTQRGSRRPSHRLARLWRCTF